MVTAAAGAALAGALVLAGTGPASAAAPIKVNCDAGADLRAAINSAPSGATLIVTGTCTGTFYVTVKDLTLKGQGFAVLNGVGGTLSVNHGTVNVVNLTLQGVPSPAGGIGTAIDNIAGTVTLRDSKVTHTAGIQNAFGTVTLYNTPVTDNRDAANGGGIHSVGGTVTLNDSPVTGNHASGGGGTGGGIHANDATVTLNNSPVTGNTAQTYGGGIVVAGGAGVKLNDSPVTGNTAGTDGGGIYVFNDPSAVEEVTLRDSDVTGNTPDNCAPSGSVPGCDD
jgi:hypothetical protein